MFPPVYGRSTSNSSTTFSPEDPMKAEKPVKAAPTPQLPSLFKQDGVAQVKATASFVAELEPFEYRPNASQSAITRTQEAGQAPTSLSSVFGDQDLIDAIMFSLDTEHGAASVTTTTSTTTTFVMPRRMQQLHSQVQVQQHQHQAFTAMMHRAHGAPMASNRAKASISVPCIRKPGTFLNKDGRWIKGKPCRMDSCDKRAQSNGLCKGHGGGARCSFEGCCKSSQGGGFCRAHGGGKRCLHEGCEKGTQRNGFCYLHGGVRSCSVEGCDKKDRGNGKCFSHGGGRKCQAHLCFNTIRRGVFCDVHNGKSAK
ncbi:hypothetical protein BBJ28_00006963 [Nothophytophthora sp. Chile5]|nr:hypothetical protein BBJ28_00006963 [Nothophytophthora sp. Chile5]